MNKIKLLPQDLINIIAAGEVVERPSSVVKELLENSIDANSSVIRVNIEDYGKKLIEVVDNGVGMNEEDALMAFEQHATSKILSKEDLENINSLGFRGEALASISSVAGKVELETKREHSKSVSINILGSKKGKGISSKSDNGTRVSIHNLFENIPARKKFLKSDSTEFKSIVNTFIDIALINTQIHFELYHNGKLIYRLTKAKNIKERMFEIIGNAANEYYDEKVIESSLCNITFILIKPENAKKTSNFQYIYVNNRRIDNKAIYTAIKEAYSGLIHRDLKPSYIVLIHIDPKLVDVNVHPRKLEVKFQDPQSIFRSVYSSVKKILGNSTKESLNDSIESVRSNDNIYKEVFTYKKPSNQNFQQYKSRPNFSTVNDAISFSKNLIESKSLYNTKDISIKPVDQKPINLRQYLNTYIVYELEDEIIFIDQHAAAEKINFEKLLYQLGTIPTKPLLIPAIIDLKDFEKEILLNKKEELKKIGIIIDDFGDNSVQVSEIPEILNNFDFFKYLENIVHDKEDFSNLTKEYTELEMSEETYQLLALTACHGSIRAGQKLNEFEMYNIINDLKSLKQPNNCPHGRPISWKLKKQEIEKNFKRII